MKAVICAIAILSFVIASTIFVAIYSNNILSDFSGTVNSCIQADTAEPSNIEKVESKYIKLKPFLTLFMCECDINELEIYLEDAKSALTAKDGTAIAETKSRLLLHIEQLRRQSVFSMEAIF